MPIKSTGQQTEKTTSKKVYFIEKIRGRTGNSTIVKGTIEDLREYFGYTLECGHSWNKKINQFPTTIKGLVKALQQSIQETQGSCFNQDSFYEATEEQWLAQENQ